MYETETPGSIARTATLANILLARALARPPIRQKEGLQAATQPRRERSLANNCPVQHRPGIDLLHQSGKFVRVAGFQLASGNGFIQ